MPRHPIVERDLGVLWHPCTQMKDHESLLPLVPIARGEGAWLWDFDGRRYLDAVSSWWVNLFGHGHPHLAAAIARQAATLPHVIFAGFTHEPAVVLAERLRGLVPPGLTRCFLADNGSAAVEVALKMSYHYWRNAGRERKCRFVALEGAYHGETLGALAVGQVELYRDTYAPLLMPVLTIPSPDAWHAGPGESPADCARRSIRALEQLLAERGEEVAALIVEPLVQCAAGMRMHDPEWLRLARAVCDRHEVHLIADEIAVGFGRTGTFFACEQSGVSPDFLCLSKGITGGTLPLAAVWTRESVYEAFYDDWESQRAFLHSHSYTGNALACAAAVATLEIFEREDVIARNRERAAWLARAAAPLGDLPHVGEVRQRGMILAVELVRDRETREPFPWQERRGLTAYRAALRQGVLLRPLGNVLYWMPPYVIEEQEAEWLGRVTRDAIIAATAH